MTNDEKTLRRLMALHMRAELEHERRERFAFVAQLALIGLIAGAALVAWFWTWQ